jgi:glycogen operon protein
MLEDNYVYVAMNMHWETLWFEVPGLKDGMKWYVFANTSVPSPNDICEPGQELLLENQSGLLVGDRSVVILLGK